MEELNSRKVIASDVTNSVAHFRSMWVITSAGSKYMISGYQPGLITKGQETQYHIYKVLVIADNIANNM